MENILKFLDIGKADFDRLNRGGINLKGATIIDMNRVAKFPHDANKKKNKNDFYRFLLG